MKKLSDELRFAIIFEEAYIDELQFPVYIAIRPVIGYLNEKATMFIDKTSSQSYINLDYAYANKLPEGFNLSTPIKNLQKSYKTLSINEAVSRTWLDLENLVYFYEKDGLEFKCCTPETFEKKFNVKPPLLSTKEMNDLNLYLIDGKITSDDYYDALYSSTYSSKINTEDETEKIFENNLPNINETIEKMKSRIIGQDETIKKVVTSVYKSIILGKDNFKSNILMYGPTGVGKTAIVKSLGEILNIPVVREDMTRFTEAGYIGKSVDDILVDLYNNAKGDLNLAENSILFLDEIDKKVDNGNDRSFNKADVLKSLLTIIEGGKYEIEVFRGMSVTFDTSNLIVIIGGAFSSLYNEARDTRNIGFESKKVSDDKIDIKKIEDAGMPSEFIGRLSLITRLNTLKYEDLITILKKSELSTLRKYLMTFKKLGIDIKISDGNYDKIAKKAEKYKKGARVLNLVTDEMFENILFTILSEGKENISEVVLGDNIVDDNSDFKLVKKK